MDPAGIRPGKLTSAALETGVPGAQQHILHFSHHNKHIIAVTDITSNSLLSISLSLLALVRTVVGDRSG
jgi:hypothetical protein